MTAVSDRTRAEGPFVNTAESDHVSPTQLWVIVGQLSLAYSLFFGFGGMTTSPKKLSGGAMVLTIACLLLAPHGRYRRIVITLPTLLVLWMWCMSYFWTYSQVMWWTAIQATIPFVVCVVIVAGLLPLEHLLRGVVNMFHAAVVFQFIWTATHFSSTTANYDPINGQIATPGWHGSFIHKNSMGPFLLIGFITLLLFEHRRRARWLGLGGNGLLILLSQSSTTWAALMVAILFHLWFNFYVRQRGRLRPAVMVLSGFAGFLLATLGTLVWKQVVGLFGKDLTFTGRTAIWQASMPAIRARPWLGYGVGGIFANPAQEPTRSIIIQIGFIVYHAHSSYFEIVLELGFIGMGLWLASVLLCMASGWRLLAINPNLGQWSLLCGLMVLMISFSEVLIGGSWLALLGMLHAVSSRELRLRKNRRGWREGPDPTVGLPATVIS